MIKLKAAVRDLAIRHPELSVYKAARKVARDIGYGRFVRYVSDSDAQYIRTKVAAAIYLIKVAELLTASEGSK